MRHQWYAAVVLVLVASLARGAAAQETGYRFITIEIEDAVTTRVFGINQRGDLVGRVRIAGAGPQYPFMRTRGGDFRVFLDLRGARLTGINEDRALVGGDDGHGLFIDAEGVRLFDVAGAIETSLAGINDAWESVGNLSDDQGALHSFLRDQDGALWLLDTPGPVSGINNHGEISGNSADGQTGFLMAADGGVTPIAVPGAAQTTVFGLNTNLEVVGGYRPTVADPQSFPHTDPLTGIKAGFVRDPDGRFIRIAVPEGLWTVATGINDEGRVAGYFGRRSNPDGAFLVETRSFLAIPCRVRPDRPDCIAVTRIGE